MAGKVVREVTDVHDSLGVTRHTFPRIVKRVANRDHYISY